MIAPMPCFYVIMALLLLSRSNNEDLDKAIFKAIFWGPIFIVMNVKSLPKLPGFFWSGAKKTWKEL